MFITAIGIVILLALAVMPAVVSGIVAVTALRDTDPNERPEILKALAAFSAALSLRAEPASEDGDVDEGPGDDVPPQIEG